MVTQVYGVANGAKIILSNISGRIWETDVPWTEDGEYAVELYADDDAGNTAYLCSMLFVISGHEMRGYVVPRGYEGTGNANDYTGMVSLEEFLGAIKRQAFSAGKQETEYQAEVQEGGYKIERVICGRDGY